MILWPYQEIVQTRSQAGLDFYVLEYSLFAYVFIDSTWIVASLCRLYLR